MEAPSPSRLSIFYNNFRLSRKKKIPPPLLTPPSFGNACLPVGRGPAGISLSIVAVSQYEKTDI
jgi:hypothetical protein